MRCMLLMREIDYYTVFRGSCNTYLSAIPDGYKPIIKFNDHNYIRVCVGGVRVLLMLGTNAGHNTVGIILAGVKRNKRFRLFCA